MSKPGISLCMIVKNEEAHLTRCLESAGTVCDELIVVDTGSSDSTIDIATSFGARVEHFPWCEDFSAARNHALQFASHEWILQLDADEQILVEDRNVVLEAILRTDVDVYHVEILNDIAGGGVATFSFPRLFRNGRGIRYGGRIHEQLMHEGDPHESGIRIHHFGYDLDAARRRTKFESRAPLLEAQIGDHPEDPFPRYNLAVLCHLAGEYERGAVHARETVERCPEGTLRLAALDLEGLCSHRAGRPERALACFKEALAIDPDYIDALFDLGALLLEHGNADGARQCYERYFQALPDWKVRPVPSTLMLRSLRSEAQGWNNLGCARRRIGDLEGARAAFESASHADPALGAACYNLGITLASLERFDDAVGPLERALELQGGNEGVRHSLDLVLQRLGETSTS